MLASLVATVAVAAGCPASLPHGPSVPAAIVLRTSCGTFRLARDGRVSRLPRRWLGRHSGGTGRRFGADIALRRTRPGAYLVLRDGRVIWRSHDLYPNDGGSVAFGPHAFAFASYRRGVFVTNLAGPERRVARGTGLFPIGFTRSGVLLVRRSAAVDAISPDGRLVLRLRYRTRNGFAFDERTDTLFLVAPDGTLTATDGTDVTRLRTLDVEGELFVAGKLLLFEAARGLVVTRRDGAVVARTRWRRLTSDSGVSISADGRAFAFRLTDGYPGDRSGIAEIAVLRAGSSRARVLARRRLGPGGCAVGGRLIWSGRFLLYGSSDGDLAVLDSRGAHPRSLVPLARALARSPGERADAWWSSHLAPGRR